MTVTGRAAPGQQLIEDRTLFIHDSFVAAWRGEFTSLFWDAVFLHWDEIREPPVMELFEDRDLLVLELVGRSYWGDSERIRQTVALLTEYAQRRD